jgi:hypothetical protein
MERTFDTCAIFFFNFFFGFNSMISHFLVPFLVSHVCICLTSLFLVPSPQNTLILKHQFMNNDSKVDAAFNIIIRLKFKYDSSKI